MKITTSEQGLKLVAERTGLKPETIRDLMDSGWSYVETVEGTVKSSLQEGTTEINVHRMRWSKSRDDL